MSGEYFPSSNGDDYIDRSELLDDSQELEEALTHIWDIAQENHLDPYQTYFDIVTPDVMNEIASYGIPGRFAHWTRGGQYNNMKTMYNYGLQKIYELVINSDPSQALLLENNRPIDNKFVMAHVLGHTDFFKNNLLFKNTPKDMPRIAAKNAERLRTYEDVVGWREVERTLDAALALEMHIDPYRPESADKEISLAILDGEKVKIPPSPDRDLLGFIKDHAPDLEDWQRDALGIVRQESLYFYPQMRTKIMNEGWAAYWHKRIMTEMNKRGNLTGDENEAWYLTHSGVVQPVEKGVNPYYLGMMVYEYLEDYYNGNLTKSEEAWLREQGEPIYPHFAGELKDSPAMPKLREAMMYNDDQSFIRNYFNKIVSDRMNMYVYENIEIKGENETYIEDKHWESVQKQLLFERDNNGIPLIVVLDGNYNDNQELLLRHEYDGRDLDPEYVEKTLPYIYKLWQRSVYLETADTNKDGEKETFTYRYDGNTMELIPAEDDDSDEEGDDVAMYMSFRV